MIFDYGEGVIARGYVHSLTATFVFSVIFWACIKVFFGSWYMMALTASQHSALASYICLHFSRSALILNECYGVEKTLKNRDRITAYNTISDLISAKKRSKSQFIANMYNQLESFGSPGDQILELRLDKKWWPYVEHKDMHKNVEEIISDICAAVLAGQKWRLTNVEKRCKIWEEELGEKYRIDIKTEKPESESITS